MAAGRLRRYERAGSKSGSATARAKPVVVQHSFGELGGGGPIGALERVLNSELPDEFEFKRMHQESATGGLDLSRIRAWASWLRETEPDLVHVRGLGNEGFHGVLAARLAGCPRVLVSVHGTVRDLAAPRTPRQQVIFRCLEPLTLRMATHVTTVCRYAASRDFVLSHRDKFVGPMVNGVDLPQDAIADRRALKRELGLSEDKVVLVSVGRLTFEKGHAVLAEALARLKADTRGRLELVVVGDGPDREAIARLYDRAPAAVRLVGKRLDVPRFLAAADVFVLPSLHENLSNALLEAMGHRLPVIASRVGGNTEVVERGGGLLVPSQDPGALAEAVTTLVQDPRLREALGAQARRVVGEHYSTARMCASLRDIYGQILAG